MMGFEDKVAIITGGASGIGAATASALAAEGAKVVVADWNPEHLKKMEAEFKQKGQPFLAFQVDVADEKKVEDLIQETVRSFGGIDLLVNNAGISPKHQGRKANLWEMPIAEWDKVMGVNIRGTFLCCHFAVPHMIRRKGGAL